MIERGKPDGFVRTLDALRADVADRILKVLPGRRAAWSPSLLVGEQTAVDKDVAQAMRDSGLAHILSISGLHIVFVVGLVMGLVRYGIALVPPLALRVDAKKVAAVLALMAALFYTALAGAPVPAQRACAMAAFALLAILLDRTALSLRLVAWSAVIVLRHRARVADRRLLPDVVRRRRRADRRLGDRRRPGAAACTSAPSSRAIAGCGASAPRLGASLPRP